MKLPTLTQLARETAVFCKYETGQLWYTVEWVDEGKFRFFQFPIPVEDAGGGAFLPRDKAITFLRWIRRRLDELRDIELGDS